MSSLHHGFYWIADIFTGHRTVAHYSDNGWSFVGTSDTLSRVRFADQYEVFGRVAEPDRAGESSS
jgi:hypothetical protein